MYKILPYSYRQAKKLGVEIKPSKNPKYKIDVFDPSGKFLCSGGQRGAMDYPTWKQRMGKTFARERRRLYHIRHRKEFENPNTRGYLIGRILW
jgi:hypothetical protein